MVGASTATYFVPSALLREYVAVVALRRWSTIAVGGPLLALAALLGVVIGRSLL